MALKLKSRKVSENADEKLNYSRKSEMLQRHLRVTKKNNVQEWNKKYAQCDNRGGPTNWPFRLLTQPSHGWHGRTTDVSSIRFTRSVLLVGRTDGRM